MPHAGWGAERAAVRLHSPCPHGGQLSPSYHCGSCQPGDPAVCCMRAPALQIAAQHAVCVGGMACGGASLQQLLLRAGLAAWIVLRPQTPCMHGTGCTHTSNCSPVPAGTVLKYGGGATHLTSCRSRSRPARHCRGRLSAPLWSPPPRRAANTSPRPRCCFRAVSPRRRA